MINFLKSMVQIRILFLILTVGLFINAGQINAQELVDNNIVGIHLNQPEDYDIEAAASLVNSAGGDWGYALLVVTEKDRDIDRLNDIFNKFRKAHLIPIIRIEKGLCGSVWCRSGQSEVAAWIKTLNSSKLHWPVKTRYVVLFNEPNHASQWGGSVDPVNFADTVDAYCTGLKQANDDFFVMMGGLDLSSPQQPPQYYDAQRFLEEMYKYKPQIFDCLDGWASHSYPNPGFVSSPSKTGRVSVAGYQWELMTLKNMGVNKDYCVYITETGWPHREGFAEDRSFHSAEVVAGYFREYILALQQDRRVCAVTPFIMNDQGELFDHFSWRMPSGENFYPQYSVVQSMPKKEGKPLQRQLVSVKADLPKELVAQSRYSFPVSLANGGQAWWDGKDGYRMGIVNADVNYSFGKIEDIHPGWKKEINFSLITPSEPGQKCLDIGFYKGEQLITDLFTWCFQVIPPPRLEFEIGRLIKTKGDNFTLQFFDKSEKLVFEKRQVAAPEGEGVVEEVDNVIVGECYRVVLLRDYYLPRQIDCVMIEQGTNLVRFEAMIPLDFNNDGKFSLRDILEIRDKKE